MAEIDPLPLGYGLIAMGGGRTRQDQQIDHRVGFELAVRVGDPVTAGQPLATVHAADEAGWRLEFERPAMRSFGGGRWGGWR